MKEKAKKPKENIFEKELKRVDKVTKKEENQKYYECIRTSTCNSFTKGKIYSIINADDLEAEFNFIDNFYEPNGFGGVNHNYFKPSTLKAYLTQEEKTKKINNATAKGFSLHEKRKKQRENKKEVDKATTSLFGMQILHSPKAHELSVAMSMVGLSTDIPAADLILRLFDKLDEMGGRFDITSAVDLQLEVTNEYEAIKEEFEKLTNKKNKYEKNRR